MPSLLEAIEDKYGQDGNGNLGESQISRIFVPKVGPRKSIPRLLILNDCDVDSAGDEEQLEKTCAGVLEIDLAHNRLSQWSEISKILQYTPSVTFLNLSFNLLPSPLTITCTENKFRFPHLPRLTALILIGTKVSWDSVWFLLRQASGLQEIHLSLNDFGTVDVDCSSGIGSGATSRLRTRTTSSESETTSSSSSAADDGRVQGNPNNNEPTSTSTSTSRSSSRQNSSSSNDSSNDGDEAETEGGDEVEVGHRSGSSSTDSGNESCSEDDNGGLCFPHIRKIMFDGNPIHSWAEVSKLGSCFPSLRHVGLADCPISSIAEDAHHNFDNLQSLSMTNTLINDLTDLSYLNSFPSLTELRIQGIPFLSELTAHERRQYMIAMLPKIKKLNGGAPISTEEREDAERAFIRRFDHNNDKDQSPPPKRYFELLSVHGELAPLVEVQLKPATRVKLKIVSGEIVTERLINVYQTTTELKSQLESLVGIRPSNMRLFYTDYEMCGAVGREEMKFPQKKLYSYNMQDGDEIHIELKLLKH